MLKIAGMMMLLAGVAGLALAGGTGPVPEIDPTSAVGAFALLSGAVLVIRGRRKK